MNVPWGLILDAAAQVVPSPADLVLRVAAAIARQLTAEGCTIEGCPANIAETLQPADLPTGERGLAALARADARAHGLDAEGIAVRRSER